MDPRFQRNHPNYVQASYQIRKNGSHTPKCQFDAVIMTGHWSSATGPKRAQSYSVNKENNGGGSLANSISEFGFNTGLMGNCDGVHKV